MREVQSAKEKEYRKKESNIDNLINNLARLIIEQNAEVIGNDVAKEAIESINDEKNKRTKKEDKKGGTVSNVKEKAKRRTTKTA